MDREYLEDYEQKELSELEKLDKNVLAGRFSFEKDKYPPEERFIKLQRPVALASLEAMNVKNLWAQVPFCGSLILCLPSFPRSWFEEYFFKISDIPKIIDFIKETGKLQIALEDKPTRYEGLDYWDPFFKELNPPFLSSFKISIFVNGKEIQKAMNVFSTLGNVRYFDLLKEISQQIAFPRSFSFVVERSLSAYIFLKLSHYAIAEEIENFMIDAPEKALALLSICQKFIIGPRVNVNSNLMNFTLNEIRTAQDLPLVYQPQDIRLPCEIGKFLMSKLTYAPESLDACKQLMYHYDACDLRKIQESLNEAIVTNNPDIVNKSTEELSEILDNVWNDKTIPRKIKGLQIGIPLSIAAIGSVAAGPIGVAGGFLAGLGYSVADKFIDLKTEGLSERLAKLKTKSYQANIYDFKKKYNAKIAHQ